MLEFQFVSWFLIFSFICLSVVATNSVLSAKLATWVTRSVSEVYLLSNGNLDDLRSCLVLADAFEVISPFGKLSEKDFIGGVFWRVRRFVVSVRFGVSGLRAGPVLSAGGFLTGRAGLSVAEKWAAQGGRCPVSHFWGAGVLTRGGSVVERRETVRAAWKLTFTCWWYSAARLWRTQGRFRCLWNRHLKITRGP